MKKNSFKEFFDTCELVVAMLDTDIVPCVFTDNKHCSLSFPMRAGGYSSDKVEFDTVEDGIAFLDKIVLIVRMGRMQRRGL